MFKIFKRQSEQIVFTEENKELFTSLLTDIYVILRDCAYSHQADWIMQILSSVQSENTKVFKEKVISVELLGGAGSVVDVWIEDKEKMERLDELMNSFLELVMKSGLNNRSIKSRVIKKL